MRYRDFLRGLHEALRPPTYLEIGVREGRSLALARCPSVGIDPGYELEEELPPTATLFRETSDRYFERPEPLAPLDGGPVALAFIDGMHLAEFALRDFVNVERLTAWTSVIVLDDVLPRSAAAAARERTTKAWSGDVYKLVEVLREHRPDLILVPVDTQPAGLLLVIGPDADSRVLQERYSELERGCARAVSGTLPAWVVERRGVLAPERCLASPLWPFLRAARASGLARSAGLPVLRALVEADLGLVA